MYDRVYQKQMFYYCVYHAKTWLAEQDAMKDNALLAGKVMSCNYTNDQHTEAISIYLFSFTLSYF